ncbi:monoacylglycerol lipase [Microbacterium laevaniformans]|uniref:alpha/beta fold hydrolase n=1 Tax=Microbacterium laevaniformans TaxID=36807 RepID=UPI00195907AB|nr:alpha/beta hydrolase [Microbacterium laevaniformans]MBM7753589.1 alpha-beta hydrolase superfamily lysophospholipase [Microbacterium laevaniformans]GLJ64146.1 monoacylglycerol lipase [Microbacterium laevaniformans]
MAAARREERSFIDPHGIRIVYDLYEPDGDAPPVRGAVQILHGVGEHAGRYTHVAEALTAAGFLVYADDHRGHGRTGLEQHGGDASRLGRLGPGGLRAAVAACAQLSGIIRADHPELPLILIGHSWGSFLAQMLLDRHPRDYDALVLTGSALRWPGSLNSGDLNAPWAGSEAMGSEWLSSDLSVGRAFLDDPLTTSEPLAKLFGPLDTLRLIGKPAKNLPRDVPLLLMIGRDDTVGGPRSIHRLAAAYRRRSGLTDVTTLIYPDIRHEVFNDVTRDEVIADLIAWIDRHLPPSG